MIQALSSNTADKTLAHGIGAWSGHRGMDEFDVYTADGPFKVQAILAIIIADQIARSCPERCGLTYLLCQPVIGR